MGVSVEDKPVSLYIDCPSWQPPVKVDDFIIAVGKLKSNSVYHVFEVKSSTRSDKRIVRYNMKVFKSDLITCLKRDETQSLITLKWYSRDKKNKIQQNDSNNNN